MSTDLLCDRCGYNLRAHPSEGACPECGTSVETSRRLATVPRRPAWGASDRRWRRRMLAGTWALALVPLVDVLRATGWADAIPIGTAFNYRGTVRTLGDTFLFEGVIGVYPPLMFCIGVVLLFAKERGRRPNRLDWTRRWGVICSYVTALLAAAPVLFISSLVLVGIGALFLSMPARYQPPQTKLFIDASAAYLRYGPQPKNGAELVQVAFSSAAMLLACVPLFDALRSSGPRRLAAALVAPLGLFSLVQLARIGQYYLAYPMLSVANVSRYGVYFCPEMFAPDPATAYGRRGVWPSHADIAVELAKWLVVLAIAVWLSVATVIAWRRPALVPSLGTPGEG